MNHSFSTFIAQTLKDASEIANARFGTVSGTVKPGDNNQVLTETDLEIGKLIVGRVRQAYSGHNVIDEEAGVIDNGADYTWVIDPIDGTSNFANGVETYGVMIGLLHHDTPVAGGIALPAFRKITVAAKGEGAFTNGSRIGVTSETKLANALVAYGIDGHQENPETTHDEAALVGKLVLAIRNLRTSNSAYDAVMVAEGRYGATLNRTSKIWDNVAPQIIIEEAGGVFTAFDGAPLDYRDALRRTGDNFTWCAGAPVLHAQLQQIIAAA